MHHRTLHGFPDFETDVEKGRFEWLDVVLCMSDKCLDSFMSLRASLLSTMFYVTAGED